MFKERFGEKFLNFPYEKEIMIFDAG